VVPNGIELRPLVENDLLTSERARFCLVAGFRPWKNHAMLVEACDVLVRKGVELEVVLVGDGPGRAAIEQEILQRGLERHVRFTGWLRDPLPTISGCHVNMNLSTHESSPNAVLEGMMLGRPSIVTDVGGNKELIEHGVNGLVVPSGDVGALVSAMEHLIRNRRLAVDLGLAARDLVAERFSIDAMVLGMDRCIAEVLE
jgi:glycosyltransferase involved in cell wall biosynthesis